MKFFQVAIILLALAGCSENEKKEQTNNLEYTFLKEKNAVNPSIIGFWKSIGNGYYLEAREDSILLYSYTKNFCYKEKNDYLEGLLNGESQFRKREDSIGIYLTDYGSKTENLQTKKDFVRIKSLPKDCKGFREMVDLPNTELFQIYKETMAENYAFRNRRNLDLDSIFGQYRDSVSTDSDRKSLFKSMGEVAALTRDHHTKVIDTNGQTLQYRGIPTSKTLMGVFEEQDTIKEVDSYFKLFFDTNYDNITNGILKGKGKKVLNDKLEWGDINDDIGYLNIHSFTGFLGNDFTRKQQIDSLNQNMQNIVAAFQDKKAIIIDVSFNFGGYDASCLTIASYFTDKPVTAYSSQVFYNDGFYEEDKVVVRPADSIRFTKPVYVLTTDISRSAAEGFAMMMDVLPNVTLVGTNTLGILSGMLGKSIGTYYTTFSNQRLVTSDGKFYEGNGVEPDIGIEVFPKDNIFHGHQSAVNDIVEMINKN